MVESRILTFQILTAEISAPILIDCLCLVCKSQTERPGVYKQQKLKQSGNSSLSCEVPVPTVGGKSSLSGTSSASTHCLISISVNGNTVRCSLEVV